MCAYLPSKIKHKKHLTKIFNKFFNALIIKINLINECFIKYTRISMYMYIASEEFSLESFCKEFDLV